MSQERKRFDTRLRQALALLETKGLGRSNYAPPLFRLLWKFGATVPPQMASFAFNGLLMGGFFGVFWGLLMWLLLWGGQGLPLAIGAMVAAFAGALFGLSMAWYMRHSARKRAIPKWRDFIPET
ncbi:DUF6404 family protein [Pseudoxanthomonas wuyuanensis]|uniref:Transmembrane protein n=1 Tax=Pseudoxanthomonas wuyuanensis TaxID=1073196 RepID=A0A286D877_9GAMM|nr:DUF6404 family protein [Pseudoxanthomonas wuyuanensis]KAF1718840.1 hypothetical protein CSC75_17745 [Pseudoxanthomonas wuyuanensis]SOD54856.1 hypothetical protein SAMN06296416_105129 [Pseudoxanthomonas wuyuanensis]